MILRHAREHPAVLQSNVWDALDALAEAGLLAPEPAAALRRGYSFLRFVEARLRIVTDRPLTEIPEPGNDLEKLARRAGYEAAEGIAATEPFLRELSAVRRSIRTVYTEVVEGLLG